MVCRGTYGDYFGDIDGIDDDIRAMRLEAAKDFGEYEGDGSAESIEVYNEELDYLIEFWGGAGV